MRHADSEYECMYENRGQVGGQGEGHRKVHARLRIVDGIRVARTRLLRVMRAHGVLSPHRGRQGDPKRHDGTIITAAPRIAARWL